MKTQQKVLRSVGVLMVLCSFCLPLRGYAQPLHSVMLSVPEHSEEALTWCGPAVAQMVMEGYPGGACTVLQEDIWAQVLSSKTEAIWDTDPAGMRGALKTLCPPPYNWSIYHKVDPAELMFKVAYWMTSNSFPVALVKDTVAHNAIAGHTEHWVAIRGIVTDADPTTTTSVTLENVWFNDPCPETLGDPAVVRFVTGTQWYDEFEPVTKVGSSYHGQYVAVIEPPAVSGVALAKIKVLFGTLITADQARESAARWIKEKKLYAFESYKVLAKAKPLPPLLVNQMHGGYYIIPYSTDGRQALAAVIVNAYTGEFEEVGAFKPVQYLEKKQAIEIAMQALKPPPDRKSNTAGPQPDPPTAELVFPRGQQVVGRYFPLWQVNVNRQTIGVSQQQHVFTRMPRLQPCLPAAAVMPRGLTLDDKNFWLFDEKTRELKSVDKRSGAPLKSFRVDVRQIGALTFGGGKLWLADQTAMKILTIDPATGNVAGAMPLNIPKGKGFDKVTGMAWDNGSLWVAMAAGFSSSINQIDPATGKIKRSLYAECDPRGIAVRNGVLYTVCFNGERLPAKIDRRTIVGQNHEMQATREFILDLDLKDPGALVHDGRYLWVLDRRLNRIIKYFPITNQRDNK
jgi:hypothetical protein